MKIKRHQMIHTRWEFIDFVLGLTAAFAITSYHFEIALCVLLVVAPYETLEEPAARMLERIKRVRWTRWFIAEEK